VVGLLALIVLAVVAGAVLLWPSGTKADIPLPFQNATGGSVTTEGGRVESSGLGDCGSPSAGQVLTAAPVGGVPGSGTCIQSVVAIDSGPNAGARTLLEFSGGPGQPNLSAGEQIRVFRQVDQQGVTSYGFYDYERGLPLAILAGVFAVVIVVVARWRGLRALAGIVVAFAVLVFFMLPALRDGAPAVPVALVASAAILFAVIYLAHGISLRTSAALLGTLTAMLLAAVLSWWAIELTQLPRECVDQRPSACRFHHRLTRRTQRRHHHPGLRGVRAGSSEPRDAQRGFPEGDAGRQRPHRQHGLHPGAGLRRQFTSAAAAVQRCGPLADRRADQ
jgi:hypothetical protein